MEKKVSDKARAYHEAAHTVVAVVMGIPVEETTIRHTKEEKTGREIHGHTKYKEIAYQSKQEEGEVVLNSVIAALAPIYTVDRIGEGEIAKIGCFIDYQRAEAIVATIAEDQEEKKELMTRANRKAKKEVDRNWQYIQAVAEELLTRETLVDDDILEIMAKTTERGR